MKKLIFDFFLRFLDIEATLNNEIRLVQITL